MSNIFANQNTDGYEQEEDRLGGGGTVPSGIYEGTVTLFYAGKSSAADSKAQSMTAHIKLDGSGFEFRESFWVTKRNGDNFYVDKQDSTKRHALPGWNMADSLCLLTTGYGLTEQEMEEKVVNLYDFDAKKELPKNVMCATPVHGQRITVAILEQTVDKNVKQADGSYAPGGETRDENVVDKFFHNESGMTVSELRAGAEEATFKDKWAEKNTGKKRNKAKGAADGAKAGAPGKPGSATSGGAPKKSLFGK